jgi:hypothetical protein
MLVPILPAEPAAFRGPVQVPASQRDNFLALFKATEGLDPRVLARALRAFTLARVRNEVRRNVLTVIDYRLPSNQKRLWVLDLERRSVLFHELVAHGEATGREWAAFFSNDVGSHKSSLGAFVTGTTYVGRHGYSLRLLGLEPGINDRALERAIVIHGADYVSPDFIRRYGRLGRSWGCPALPVDVAEPLIDAIKDGSLVFSYYPDPDLEHRSRYLQ